MTDPRATLRSYTEATDAHDLRATVDLVRDDAVYWFSDATSHVGIAAVRAVLESNFSAISNETYEISSHRWIVETDSVAVCLYRFNWSGTIDGEPASGSGRGTSVLVITTEGWRIAHEHLSSGDTGFEPVL
jgi:ketosteroid isomerase-like protein